MVHSTCLKDFQVALLSNPHCFLISIFGLGILARFAFAPWPMAAVCARTVPDIHLPELMEKVGCHLREPGRVLESTSTFPSVRICFCV